jgi:hypothetical protein
MLRADRALARLSDLELDEDATESFLSGNARRVFQLDREAVA